MRYRDERFYFLCRSFVIFLSSRSEWQRAQITCTRMIYYVNIHTLYTYIYIYKGCRSFPALNTIHTLYTYYNTRQTDPDLAPSASIIIVTFPKGSESPTFEKVPFRIVIIRFWIPRVKNVFLQWWYVCFFFHLFFLMSVYIIVRVEGIFGYQTYWQ